VPSFLFGIKLGQCANVVERWRNQRDDLINKTVFNVATFGLAIDMIAMPSSRVMAKAAAKAKTLKGSAVIEGTGGKTVPGACASTDDPYAEICPSGNCECFTITDAKVEGRLYGKGNADVFASIDEGDPLSDTPPTCLPVYGEVILNTRGKKAATETINFQGAFCAPESATSKGSVGAAWEIVDTTNDESGLGTVTGRGVHEGSNFDITLTGTATITP
jgi:hypothetical protein